VLLPPPPLLTPPPLAAAADADDTGLGFKNTTFALLIMYGCRKPQASKHAAAREPAVIAIRNRSLARISPT
jgi:hypothetical protein